MKGSHSTKAIPAALSPSTPFGPSSRVQRPGRGRVSYFLVCLAAIVFFAPTVRAQQGAAGGKEFYDQIRAFSLTGGSARVTGLVLKRDRVNMTFTGTFYFAAPIEGHVTGAVFMGDGTFSAPVPPILNLP